VLEGKVAIVTGGGGGIGRGIVERFVAEGASVVFAEVDVERARGTQVAVGGRVVGVVCDVREPESSEALVVAARDNFGRVDVLVNNVGDMASSQHSWRELDEATVDHVLDVDIKGTMLMVHEFGVRMLDRGARGAIVNIGSTVIVRGSPRAPIYAAGKYGLLGITKSYAKALAPQVRVNTFAPGFMDTPAVMERPDMKGGRLEQITRDTPMGRIPPPEDLTGAALFLASDDAIHITGSYMICDGGYSMLGA
jgi:3-oxoacyl-[acyl-carrier protein] reductase